MNLQSLKNNIAKQVSDLGFELTTSFEGKTEHICNVKLASGITQSIIFSENNKSRNHGIKFYTNGWLSDSAFNHLMYTLGQPGYKYESLTNRYIKI